MRWSQDHDDVTWERKKPTGVSHPCLCLSSLLWPSYDFTLLLLLFPHSHPDPFLSSPFLVFFLCLISGPRQWGWALCEPLHPPTVVIRGARAGSLISLFALHHRSSPLGLQEMELDRKGRWGARSTSFPCHSGPTRPQRAQEITAKELRNCGSS